MPTDRINGHDLYWERHGQGPPVLFLNGSGATLATAGPLVAVLGRRLDVVAFDQRGLGRSSTVAEPYAMADLAADALALADHVGWERFGLLGVSFGGMVAQEVAVTAPGRIERLALLCTSPGGAGGASYPLHQLADLPPAERDRARLGLLDTRFTPAWLADHPSDRALVAAMAGRAGPERSEEVLAGERLQLAARAGHDVYDRLGAITCPTLVAAGRYDGIAPPANGAAIAAAVSGAELRLYEGGHMFFLQDPGALGDIEAFLTAG